MNLIFPYGAIRLFVTPAEILNFIASTMNAKCQLTYIHSVNVSLYAAALAARVLPERIDQIRIAGLLHDVGKLFIRHDILNNKGRLTDDEYKIMQQHPIYGEAYIETISQFKQCAPIIRHHHEHWDGSGYPDNIKGQDIPLEARIISLADSFDAMTGIRRYRSSLSRELALIEIQSHAGSQFDPHLTNHFLSLFY